MVRIDGYVVVLVHLRVALLSGILAQALVVLVVTACLSLAQSSNPFTGGGSPTREAMYVVSQK
jgi:hypothetical protein